LSKPAKGSSLAEYERKRNFEATAEPRPGPANPKELADDSFVIQKHDATRLHYDFRLEIGGTLKSWAVPKGMPMRKGEKRLAVQVEDHPLEYASFEGIIPAGNYGGGTVMVWDFGTYFLMGGEPRSAWEAGMLHMALDGKKLRGEWTLVRMKDRTDKHEWLLLKTGEDLEDFDAENADRSAVTHRTMEEIAAAADAPVWSGKPSPKAGAKAHAPAPEPAAPPETRRARTRRLAEMPAFIAPMKPVLVDALPPDPGQWLYEIKFDGYRALALKGGDAAELWSASKKPLQFPEVAAAVAGLSCESAVFDGEVVALDEQGRPSFQLLQNAAESRPALCYYVFDLLQLDGRDLRKLPAVERKARLAKLIEGQPPGGMLRFSASLDGEPGRLVDEIRRLGLEGLVAKQRESVYETGRRSAAWQKFRLLNEQEFVIGGYTRPEGSRKHFGALLVGYHDAAGKLLFAAKVGTGFSAALLARLFAQFQPLRRPGCPFVNLPSPSSGRWGAGVTASKMKSCTWLAPELICQVRFSEWTFEGGLRQPVFLGLRDDKPASAVVREQPVHLEG
jgi:bifunctional non-homologous end joining protein LigD